MRLLTKSEVQQELAVERKMQIDEGISLARKVDGLRQKATSEEAALEQFRTGTTSVVIKEVEELIEKRDNLKVEVRSLEEQRDTALDPLYTKEAEVDKKLEALEAAKQHLIEREEAVATAERELEVKRTELSRDRGTLDSELTEATEYKRAARDIFLAARVKESQVNDDLGQREAKVLGRERSVAVREQAVAGRERDAENKLNTAKRIEREVVAREQALNDREETYQRNVERDGKRSKGRK